MTDYDTLLEQIEAGIEEASRKVESGRVNDIENEQIRLDYLRELNNLANTKRNVIFDRKQIEGGGSDG